MCVSSVPLPAQARDAVAASAERLGYGRENVAWVEVTPTAGERPTAVRAEAAAGTSAETGVASAPEVAGEGSLGGCAELPGKGTEGANSAAVEASDVNPGEERQGAGVETYCASTPSAAYTAKAVGEEPAAAEREPSSVAAAEAGSADVAPLTELQLRTIVEGLDPVALVVADAAAAALLAEAYRRPLFCDHPNRLSARSVAAFSNFAALLETPEGKQRAWSLLKELALE
ncbi:hypothetical protein [Parvibacter caecicola]|uniref:hypothetical protein n=1 Tax=Parvibacter caecicola TaxID=747645 RepID=UPI002499F297|nr:hypothetical protein [Parvibacter caecicola]